MGLEEYKLDLIQRMFNHAPAAVSILKYPGHLSGFGIGLFTSARIIEHHGGFI